ncbi:mCG128713, partial [Mus musculus]
LQLEILHLAYTCSDYASNYGYDAGRENINQTNGGPTGLGNVNLVYTTSAFSKFYKQSVVADVSNNKGGLLVHFWIVFVMPHAKGHIFCEECVAAILKDSIQTSIINRTSVGSLQGLAVDMDSVVLNGDCWLGSGQITLQL